MESPRTAAAPLLPLAVLVAWEVFDSLHLIWTQASVVWWAGLWRAVGAQLVPPQPAGAASRVVPQAGAATKHAVLARQSAARSCRAHVLCSWCC